MAGEEILEMPPPMGGVNTRTHPTLIGMDEYAMIRNFNFMDNLGAFVTRKGTKAKNELLPGNPLIGTPVDGAHRFYYGTNSKIFVMAAGTSIYSVADDGTTTDIKSGITAGKEWTFGDYLDACFMANGVEIPWRYNGTYVRAMGFPKPAAVFFAAAGSAGVLTGVYKYRVTFLYDSSDANESSVNSIAATASPSAQRVNLTSIPVGAAGSGVTGRVIYRTTAGGSTYYYLARIADNTTTTYTDNTADASLGTSIGPEDNNQPQVGAYGPVFWRGRAVMWKGTRLYLSAISSTEKSPGGGTSIHGAGIEIFPTSHYIDVGDDNSDIIMCAVVNDLLVIFKEDQIWNLHGDDGQDLQLFRSQSAVGCIGKKTVVNMPGSVFFVGRNDGAPAVYSYGGGQTDDVSLPIEPTLAANIYALGDRTTVPRQPCAVRFRGAYMLCYQKDGAGDTEIAILDLRPPRPRWTFWNNIPASCFVPCNGEGDAGEMFFGSRTDGQLIQLDYGSTEFVSPSTPDIIGYIETGWMDLKYPGNVKELHWIDIYCKVGTAYGGGCDPVPGETKITVRRIFDLDTTSYTEANAANVNITTHAKHMSRKLCKYRVNCGGSEQTVPEIFYRLKLAITTTAPIEIFKILLGIVADSAEYTHGQT